MVDLIHEVVLEDEVSGGKQVDVVGHEYVAARDRDSPLLFHPTKNHHAPP
jgi:hypothetical protein